MIAESEHLLKLAARGTNGGVASGGELRAFRMVDSLRRNLYGIDVESLRGLHELIDALYYDPTFSRDTIDKFIGEESARSDSKS